MGPKYCLSSALAIKVSGRGVPRILAGGFLVVVKDIARRNFAKPRPLISERYPWMEAI